MTLPPPPNRRPIGEPSMPNAAAGGAAAPPSSPFPSLDPRHFTDPALRAGYADEIKRLDTTDNEAQRAQGQQQKAADAELRKQTNLENETKWRAEGRPIWKGDDGYYRPEQDDATWEAQQQAKQAKTALAESNKQIAATLKAEGRKAFTNPITGQVEPAESADAAKTRQQQELATAAEKARRAGIAKELVSLDADIGLHQPTMTETQRARAGAALDKAQREAVLGKVLPALSSKVQELDNRSKGSTWNPFDNDAEAAQQAEGVRSHLADLNQRLATAGDKGAIDLTPEDESLIDAPLLTALKGQREKLAAHDETVKTRDALVAKQRDLRLRLADPAKWEQKQMQDIAALPEDQLDAEIEGRRTALEARGAAIQEKQAAHGQLVAGFQQKQAELEAQNEAALAQGLPAGDIVDLSAPDGTSKPWKRSLAAEYFRLHQQAGEIDRQGRELAPTLHAEAGDYEQERRLLNAVIERKNGLAQKQRDDFLSGLRSNPVTAPHADALESIDAEAAIREGDLATMYAPGTPEHEAATAALHDDVAKQREGVLQSAAASAHDKGVRGAQFYQSLKQWNPEIDWTNPPAETANVVNQHAQELGLSPEEARAAIVQNKAADWSTPHQPGILEKVGVGIPNPFALFPLVRGDTETAKRTAVVTPTLDDLTLHFFRKEDTTAPEQYRNLPDGTLSMNPLLTYSPDAYKKAVDNAQATPEAKQAAMQWRETAAEAGGEEALPLLQTTREYPAFVEAQSKKDPAFAQLSPAAQAARFLESRDSRSYTGKVWDQIRVNTGSALLGIAQTVTGTATMVTGSDAARDLTLALDAKQKKNAAQLDIIGSSSDKYLRTGGSLLNNALQMGATLGAGALAGKLAAFGSRLAIAARGAGSMAEFSESMGAIARAESAANKAGMTVLNPKLIQTAQAAGSGLGEGLQAASQMYPDAFHAYHDQLAAEHPEMSEAEITKTAHKAALVPVLTSALTTSVIGFLGGQSGAEVILHKGGLDTAKKGFFNLVRNTLKIAGREAPKEAIEEFWQTAADELNAQATYDPKRKVGDMVGNVIESAFQGALLGAGFAGVHGALEHFAATKTDANGSPAVADLHRRPEIVAAAQAYIDGLDESQSPFSKATLQGVLKVAQGTALKDLTPEERAGIDVVEDPAHPGQFINGKIVPAGDPNGGTKLVKFTGGQVADEQGGTRSAHVVMENGNPIIAQDTIDALDVHAPAVALGVGLRADEARGMFAEKNAAAEEPAKAGTANTETPIPAEVAGASGHAETSPPNMTGTSGPGLSGAKEAGADSSVAPGGGAVSKGTADQGTGLPAKEEETGRQGDTEKEPPNGKTAKGRAALLARDLSDRGLDTGVAKDVAEAHVKHRGVIGEHYTEQIASDAFAEDMKALGVSGSFKERTLKDSGDTAARIEKFGQLSKSKAELKKPGDSFNSAPAAVGGAAALPNAPHTAELIAAWDEIKKGKPAATIRDLAAWLVAKKGMSAKEAGETAKDFLWRGGQSLTTDKSDVSRVGKEFLAKNKDAGAGEVAAELREKLGLSKKEALAAAEKLLGGKPVKAAAKTSATDEAAEPLARGGPKEQAWRGKVWARLKKAVLGGKNDGKKNSNGALTEALADGTLDRLREAVQKQGEEKGRSKEEQHDALRKALAARFNLRPYEAARLAELLAREQYATLKEAQEAAIKALPVNQRRWAQVTVNAMNEALENTGIVYDQILFGRAAWLRLGGSAIAVQNVGGKISLLVDVDEFIGQHAWMNHSRVETLKTMEEEWIHAGQVANMRAAADLAEMSAMWRQLAAANTKGLAAFKLRLITSGMTPVEAGKRAKIAFLTKKLVHQGLTEEAATEEAAAFFANPYHQDPESHPYSQKSLAAHWRGTAKDGLTADLRTLTWQAYNARDISRGRKPRKVPKLRDQQAANMALEFGRMFIQKKDFRNKVTESAGIDHRGILDWLKRLLSDLVDNLGRFFNEAPQEVQAAIEGYRATTLGALAQIMGTRYAIEEMAEEDARIEQERGINASPRAAESLREKLRAEEAGLLSSDEAAAAVVEMRLAQLQEELAAEENSSPKAAAKLKQRLLSQARAGAYLAGESRAEIEKKLKEGTITPEYARKVGTLLEIARGAFEWVHTAAGIRDRMARDWSVAGDPLKNRLREVGVEVQPDGYLKTTGNDSLVEAVGGHLIIRQSALDELKTLLPITRQLVTMDEREARRKLGVRRDAETTRPGEEEKKAADKRAESPRQAEPIRAPVSSQNTAGQVVSGQNLASQDSDKTGTAESPMGGDDEIDLSPGPLGQQVASTEQGAGRTESAPTPPPQGSQSPSLPVSQSIFLGKGQFREARFASREDADAFALPAQMAEALNPQSKLSAEQREAIKERGRALRNRLVTEAGHSKSKANEIIEGYRAAVLDEAKKADPFDGFTPQSFERFARFPEKKADAPAVLKRIAKDKLKDPTGSDVISLVKGVARRIGFTPESYDSAEWEWYRALEEQARSSALHLDEAKRAAAVGEVEDPKALLEWINQNVVDVDGGRAIDEVAGELATDGYEGHRIDLDATELGPAILDAVYSRQRAIDQPETMDDYLEAEGERLLAEEQEREATEALRRAAGLAAAPKTGRLPLEDRQSAVLEVDEHGKNIVWREGDFSIAVDDPEDAAYVTLWKNGVRGKVGSLRLTPGRENETRGYASVANVEVMPQFRKRGLGGQLYQQAVHFLGERFKGLASENADRANKRQVPAIWRALGAQETEAGHYLLPLAAADKTGPGRSYESMTFDPPFATPFGDILSYNWMSRPAGARLVSDWNQSRTNPLTGREIVHHFKVRRNGETSTVSLETALGQLSDAQRAKLQGMIRSEQERRRDAANGQMALFAAEKTPEQQDRLSRDMAFASQGGGRRLDGEEAAGLNLIVRVGGESRRRFLPQVWDMLKLSYAKQGLQYQQAGELLEESTLHDVVLGADKKPVAVVLAKVGERGYKLIALATNGSAEGKLAARALIGRLKTGGYYAELSDAPQAIAEKAGVPKVPATEAGEILGKQVTPEADGFSYSRTITGLSEPHIKVIFGKPWKTKNAQQPSTPSSSVSPTAPTLPSASESAKKSSDSPPEPSSTISSANSQTLAAAEKADRDYLAAVQRGDMTTAQRMVDEAAAARGYTLRAYHGTPTAGFTVFKDRPTYFAPEEELARQGIDAKAAADVFQSSSASSIRASMLPEDRTPGTLTTYLRAERIFDTREPAHRELFEREFLNKGGEEWSSNGTPITSRDLPDWTDGRDLVDWIQETGQPFDAIVLDEGSLPQMDGTVKWRGPSLVIWNPKQIKSAEPVTFDAKGKAVPLSQRFDRESDSILYAAEKVDRIVFHDTAAAALSEAESIKTLPADPAQLTLLRGFIPQKAFVGLYGGQAAVNRLDALRIRLNNRLYAFAHDSAQGGAFAQLKADGNALFQGLAMYRGMLRKMVEREPEMPADMFAGRQQERPLPSASEPEQLILFAAKKTDDTPRPRLQALHNLSIENLVFADRIGGLAVPSVAVTTEGQGMSGFGGITLIGQRDLVDPAFEPVFDADAYSPRFPEPDWPKARTKDTQKVVDRFRAISRKFDDWQLTDQIWDNAVNRPNPMKTVQHMLTSQPARAAFLETLGITIEPVMRDKTVEAKWITQPAFAKYRENPSLVKQLNANDDAAMLEMGQAVKAAIEQQFGQIQAGDENEPVLRAVMKDNIDDFVDPATGKIHFGRTMRIERSLDALGKQEVNRTATDEKLDEAMAGKESAFKDWIESQILPLYGEPTLKVKGRKVPYTLDNIVEAMTGRVRGREDTATFGEGTARAAISKRFKNLEEMRKAAAAQVMDENAVSEARDKAQALLKSWREEVSNYTTLTNYRGAPDIWAALAGAMKALAKWAKNGRTASSMAVALRTEGFKDVPAEVIEQGMEAGQAWLNAPVPYFEAKPQRAVRLTEFAGAVIPETAPAGVAAILDKHGIKHRTYPEHNNAERTRITAELARDLAEEGAATLFAADKTGPREVEPGFYSRLSAAIEQAEFGQAKPKQPMHWKGVIEKWARSWNSAGGSLWRKGIAAEEIKWSGIMPWLDAQSAPVTKAEVLDYLGTQGAVRFEEKRLGGFDSSPLEFEEVDFEDSDEYKKSVGWESGVTVDRYGDTGIFAIRERKEGGFYSTWTPESSRNGGTQYVDSYETLEEAKDAFAEYRTAPSMWAEDSHNGTTIPAPKFAQYTLPGGENYREVVVAMPDLPSREWEELADKVEVEHAAHGESERYWQLVREQNTGPVKQAVYTSSHFPDVPNYLAHYRASDRVDAEGQPGTLLEELQYDRHQAGREKGYAEKQVPTSAKMVAKTSSYTLWDVFDQKGTRMASDKDAATEQEAIRSVAEQTTDGIPDAPYRATWPLMLFKRALREAVETGKQWIGWTTGETQAERYDLSKQLSDIVATRVSDSQFSITAHDKKGEAVINGQYATAESLPDIVGKELAQKIITNPAQRAEYSGLDLKVGGEGMRGFYDSILLKEIGKYVKQWGAGVVKGHLELPLSASERFAIVDATDTPDEGYYDTFPSREQAERALARYDGGVKIIPLPAQQTPIWRIDITPQMRESVAAGQPLFAASKTETAVAIKTDLDIGAHEAATSPLNGHAEPSEAQKAAGNYKMGRVRLGPMDISIENPAGSVRSGTDKGGKPWSVTMADHYGYVRDSEGKDGDHVDIFIEPGTPEDFSGPVFVVNQMKADGSFDEHKAILGPSIDTPEAARAEYLKNYSPGWKGAGSIVKFRDSAHFHQWVTARRRIAPASEGSAGTPARSESDADKSVRAPLENRIAAPGGQTGSGEFSRRATSDADTGTRSIAPAAASHIVSQSDGESIPLAMADKTDERSRMASDTGAAQHANEPSPGGLSEVNAFNFKAARQEIDDLLRRRDVLQTRPSQQWDQTKHTSMHAYGQTGASLSKGDELNIALWESPELVRNARTELANASIPSIFQRRDSIIKEWEREKQKASDAAIEYNRLTAEIEARVAAMRSNAQPVFLRWGTPPKGGKSQNSRDGLNEAGVSAYHAYLYPDGTIEIPNSTTAMIGAVSGFFSRPAFLLKGQEIGSGSDGEPVVKMIGFKKVIGNPIFHSGLGWLSDPSDGDSEASPTTAPASGAERPLAAASKTDTERLQKAYGAGATAQLRPNRSTAEFFNVQSLPFHIENDIPVGDGRQLAAAEIIQRNNAKGNGVLYRISVVERENGEKYSQVEEGVELRGSFSGIDGRFEPMSEYELERNSAVIDRARKLWESVQRDDGQMALFAASKTGDDLNPLARLGWNHLDRSVSAKIAAHTRWAREGVAETVAGWVQHENVAPFAAVARTIKGELIPASKLPAEVLAKKREMDIRIAMEQQRSLDLVRALSGKPKFSDMAYPKAFVENPRAREQLFDAMEGRVPMSSLPPEMQRIGAKLRGMLVKIGQEAVKQGRMSLDTFEGLKENFMPRFTRDEAEATAGDLWKRFKLGVKDILQQRTTAWHIVDTTRKDHRTGEYVTVPWDEKGKRWRFRDQQHRDAFYESLLRREALHALQTDEIFRRDLMAPLEAKEKRELRDAIRGLTVEQLDRPAELTRHLQQITGRAIQHMRGRFKKLAPIVPDDLVRDPVYAIARYAATMTHDNATAEFFNFVLSKPEYVSASAASGFTEIPDNTRFGRLAGKFVRDDIAGQILELVHAPSAAMAMYDTILGWWKTGKTVLNPGTHMRNLMGNTFFSQLAGNSVHNPGNLSFYKKAVTALREGGADYTELYENGVLGADYASQELRGVLRDLVPGPAVVEEQPGVLMGIGKTLGRLLPSMIKSPVRAVVDFAVKAYQVEDDVFKAAAYFKARAMGLDGKAAAEHVRKWFPYFDGGSSGTLRALGRTALPFLGFYRESARIFGNALKERPLALATGMAIPSLITLISAMLLGLDDDDLDEVKRDMRGKGGKLGGLLGLSGVPVFSMLLPLRTADGQLQQFDISAIHPFADFMGQRVEANQSEGWYQNLWRSMLAAGPLGSLAYSQMTGRDTFGDRPFVEPNMTTGEKAGARLDNAAKTLLPPLAPFGTGWKTLASAGERQTNKTFETRDPVQAVARAVGGVDLRGANPNLYRLADDWRAKNGLPAGDGADYGTTPVSRARAALFHVLAQDEPNTGAVRRTLDFLKKEGHAIDSMDDIRRLLALRNPLEVIRGKDNQQRFRASLNGEARRVLDEAVAEYQRIVAKAPGVIFAAAAAQ